ncbi:MAG TPA: helix-turn-helix transcriptional regulator [Arachnia sp.]|nr:helix-turn-helix transcriptional regulator [Arachnia sp.]HMT85441.1 helix-turn-helix transcriptional regulator [Arachnia sp.]
MANADLSIDSKLPPGLNPPAPIDVERLRARARQIKESKGLSIQDLVMASGLSRTAVLDMLNGRGRVAIGRVDTWWALAWALEVPFSELMRSLDEPAEGADRTPPGTDASR